MSSIPVNHGNSPGGLLQPRRNRMVGRENPALPVQLLAGLLFVALWIAAPTAALAHHPSSGANAVGLEISAISHSEMEFVSPYHSDIIALAERQPNTDERLRRLLNYSQIQYAYCLWGLVPGSISNEDSSFNACSHAYLAASWSLLQHLETMPAAKMSAQAILRGIDAERVANPLLVMCENSAEIFHTDDFVVPIKPGAAGSWLAAVAVAGGLATSGIRRLRSRSGNGAQS